jgi:hypothetical protein
MDRAAIERAIEELDELLLRDVADEAPYQAWFERHPVVFAALGYQRTIAHPRIAAPDGAEWIPDFLVLRSTAWELFEIKTPQAAILLDRERRYKFYAEFESYVAQCREYSEALDDPRTRDAVKERYDIALHKDPIATIVSGRSSGLDREKLQALARSRIPPLEVLTYDDLRSHLEFYRVFHFGQYESAKGFGLAAVVVLCPPPRGEYNYLLELGDSPDRDHVAFFIDPNGYLRLRVTDSTGVAHETHSQLPLEESDYGTPRLLVVGAGASETFGFLSIVMDQKYYADIRIENFPFTLHPNTVLGSNLTRTAFGHMCVAVYMILAGPPSFHQRGIIAKWADEQHMRPLSQNSSIPLIVFQGREAMRSGGPGKLVAFGEAPQQVPCPCSRKRDDEDLPPHTHSRPSA